VASFRIADTLRRRDPESGEWSDSKTTWYTAQVWGDQAINVAESLKRSDAVIVTGHPWLEEWRREDGELSTRLVIDADGVGPDLAFGLARFSRALRGSGPAPEGEATVARDDSGASDGVDSWQRGRADEGDDVEPADTATGEPGAGATAPVDDLTGLDDVPFEVSDEAVLTA